MLVYQSVPFIRSYFQAFLRFGCSYRGTKVLSTVTVTVSGVTRIFTKWSSPFLRCWAPAKRTNKNMMIYGFVRLLWPTHPWSPVSDEKPALIFVYGSGFAFVPHKMKWNPKIHHVQKEHHLPNPVLLYTCSSCAKYITHHPKFQARLAQYWHILMWCTQT